MLLLSARILSFAILTSILQCPIFGAPLENVIPQTHDSLKAPLAGPGVESLSPNLTIPIDSALFHSLLPRQTPPSRPVSPFGQLNPLSRVKQSPVFSPPREVTRYDRTADQEAHRNRRLMSECPSNPRWQFKKSSCIPNHSPQAFAITCTGFGYLPGRPELTLLSHTDVTSCKDNEICVDVHNYVSDSSRVFCINQEYHMKTQKPEPQEQRPHSAHVGSVAPRDLQSIDPSGHSNTSHLIDPHIDLQTFQHGLLQGGQDTSSFGANHMFEPRGVNAGRLISKCPSNPAFDVHSALCTPILGTRAYHIQCKGPGSAPTTFNDMGFCAENERCVNIGRYEGVNALKRAWCIMIDHFNRVQALPIKDGLKEQLLAEGDNMMATSMHYQHLPVPDMGSMADEHKPMSPNEVVRKAYEAHQNRPDSPEDLIHGLRPGSPPVAMDVHRPGSPLETIHERALDGSDSAPDQIQLSDDTGTDKQWNSGMQLEGLSTAKKSKTQALLIQPRKASHSEPLNCPEEETWPVVFSRCHYVHRPRGYYVQCRNPTSTQWTQTHGFCKQHERCEEVETENNTESRVTGLRAICVPNDQPSASLARLAPGSTSAHSASTEAIHKRTVPTAARKPPIYPQRRLHDRGMILKCPTHPSWTFVESHCLRNDKKGFMVECYSTYTGELERFSEPGSCAENERCLNVRSHAGLGSPITAMCVADTEPHWRVAQLQHGHGHEELSTIKQVSKRGLGRNETALDTTPILPRTLDKRTIRPINTCPDHPSWPFHLSHCHASHLQAYLVVCSVATERQSYSGRLANIWGMCAEDEVCVELEVHTAVCMSKNSLMKHRHSRLHPDRPPDYQKEIAPQPPMRRLGSRAIVPTNSVSSSVALRPGASGSQTRLVTCPDHPDWNLMFSRCTSDHPRNYYAACQKPIYMPNATPQFGNWQDLVGQCAVGERCVNVKPTRAACVLDTLKIINIAQLAVNAPTERMQKDKPLTSGLPKDDLTPTSSALQSRNLGNTQPVKCPGEGRALTSRCIDGTQDYSITCEFPTFKSKVTGEVIYGHQQDHRSSCAPREVCKAVDSHTVVCTVDEEYYINLANTALKKGQEDTKSHKTKSDGAESPDSGPSSLTLQPRADTVLGRAVTCHGSDIWAPIESRCFGVESRKYWIQCEHRIDKSPENRIEYNALCLENEHCVQATRNRVVCMPRPKRSPSMKQFLHERNITPGSVALQPRTPNSHQRTITCHGHHQYRAIESHCMGAYTRKYWIVCEDRDDKHLDKQLEYNALCQEYEHCVQISSMTAVCERNTQESKPIASLSIPKGRNFERDVSPALIQPGTLLPRDVPRPVTCPDATAQAMSSRCLTDNPRAYWVACKGQRHEDSPPSEQIHEGWNDHTGFCGPQEHCVNIDSQHAGCIPWHGPIMQPWRLEHAVQEKQPSVSTASNSDPGLKSLMSRARIGRSVTCHFYPTWHVLESHCDPTNRRKYHAHCAPPESVKQGLWEYMETDGFCEEHEICQQVTQKEAVCVINTERYVRFAKNTLELQRAAQNRPKADTMPKAVEKRELCQRDPMGQCLSTNPSRQVDAFDRTHVKCPGYPNWPVSASGCISHKRYWATCIADYEHTPGPGTSERREGSCPDNKICMERAGLKAACVSISHTLEREHYKSFPWPAATEHLTTSHGPQTAESLQQRSLAVPDLVGDLSRRQVCQRDPMGQCLTRNLSVQTDSQSHSSVGQSIKCPGHHTWTVTQTGCINKHTTRYWASCVPPGERAHPLSNLRHFQGTCPENTFCKEETVSRAACVTPSELDDSTPDRSWSGGQDASSESSSHLRRSEISEREVCKRGPMGQCVSSSNTVHPESSELSDSRPVGCVRHPEWVVTRSSCVMSDPREYFTVCEPSPHNHVGGSAHLSGHKTGHGHCEEQEYCKQVTPSKAVCAKKSKAVAVPETENLKSKHQPQQQIYMDLLGGYTHTPLVSRGVVASQPITYGRPVSCPHHRNWLVTQSRCTDPPGTYTATCQPPPNLDHGMPLSEETGRCESNEFCHQMTFNMAFCLPNLPHDPSLGRDEPETSSRRPGNTNNPAADPPNAAMSSNNPSAASDVDTTHFINSRDLTTGREVSCPEHPELTVQMSRCVSQHPRRYYVTCASPEGPRTSHPTPWVDGYGECEKGERCLQVTNVKAMCVSKTAGAEPSPEQKKLRAMPKFEGHAVGL